MGGKKYDSRWKSRGRIMRVQEREQNMSYCITGPQPDGGEPRTNPGEHKPDIVIKSGPDCESSVFQ